MHRIRYAMAAYKGICQDFEGGHETVTHPKGEWVRGDVHTNTVEGFFSLLKRGVYGTFHAVSKLGFCQNEALR